MIWFGLLHLYTVCITIHTCISCHGCICGVVDKTLLIYSILLTKQIVKIVILAWDFFTTLGVS